MFKNRKIKIKKKNKNKQSLIIKNKFIMNNNKYNIQQFNKIKIIIITKLLRQINKKAIKRK